MEDNPGDVRLMREALKLSKGTTGLSVVSDGEDAMLFLRRQGRYSDSPCPDLVLLDLNLPKKDGREVLAEIKQDPALKHIPVIIMTSSEAEQDVFRSYSLHANCYVTKPVDLDRFLKVVASIESFWSTVAKLPLPIRTALN